MIEFFREDEFEEGRPVAEKIIYGSLIIGSLMILLGIITYILEMIQLGGSIVILGLTIALLPYGVLSFFKNRAIREIEDEFPSFLQDLAESKRGGMTIIQAFESSKNTDYGRINDEIEKIYNELTWGVPFPEVMERFSKRMEDSTVIQQSISILLQSFRNGGNITQTIESIAQDSSNLKQIIQEKNTQIKQQVLIMYIIYFLFVGITVGIYLMLSQLLGLGNPGEGALTNTEFIGGSGEIPNYCSGDIIFAEPLCGIAEVFGFVPGDLTSLASERAQEFKYGAMAYYKSLLFAMLMIQGLCTGAVAGQIKEGTPTAGVKHALVMLPIAFVVFMYFVGSAGL